MATEKKTDKTAASLSFTPGPWMYRPNPGRSKKDWSFHIDRQGTPGRMNWGILIAACWDHVSESAEANARLIAAAPALYEAAKAALDYIVDDNPGAAAGDAWVASICDRLRDAVDLVNKPREEPNQ